MKKFILFGVIYCVNALSMDSALQFAWKALQMDVGSDNARLSLSTINICVYRLAIDRQQQEMPYYFQVSPENIVRYMDYAFLAEKYGLGMAAGFIAASVATHVVGRGKSSEYISLFGEIDQKRRWGSVVGKTVAKVFDKYAPRAQSGERSEMAMDLGVTSPTMTFLANVRAATKDFVLVPSVSQAQP